MDYMSEITGHINAVIPPPKAEIKLRQKSAFAVQHLMAAARFAKMCGKVELEHAGESLGNFYNEEIAFVSAAVLLSVASLESNINEFLSEPEKLFLQLNPEAHSVVVGLLEKESILEKYNKVLALRGLEAFDKGSEPYQSVDILIKLRNALVHFKPEWHDEQKEHLELGKQLRGKFALNPFIREETGVLFPQRCMSYGCAKWAVESSLAFMKAFCERMGFAFRFEKFKGHLATEVS
jgi:hypothetical protein